MMRFLAAALLALLPLSAHAQETVTPVAALTMHGTPKYGPGFTHMDYTNPDAPKGGTLRLHAIGTFDSLNPFIIKGTPAAGMLFLGQSLIYDSLMDQSTDEPFSMYCLICETVELPKDNKSITFNLRKEAKWHDGVPVTADDVVWSFNIFMEKGSPFFKAYYDDVQEVVVETPTRVTFKFKHGDNSELPLILSQISILPKHYWTAEGRDFGASSLVPPLGGGAYKVGKVAAGRSIEYVRVPDYWGKDLPLNKGKFNFDRITYDYYRDSDVALEAFLAGEYDVRDENTAKLWAESYNVPQVKDGRIIKAEIPHKRPAGMQGFIYNTRRPVFADKKVREALAYAFDFEWSNKQFAFGSYKRSRSYFSNSDLASSGLPQGRELEILEKYRGKIPDEVFTTEYNPPKSDGSGNNRAGLAKAKEILDAAGWAMGPDGIRAKNGVKLEFEIIDSNPQFERWTLPFVSNLKKLGIKANFRTVDPAQYQNRMNEFDYDMTVMSIGQSDSPGNEQRDFWSSQKADMPGSRNYMGVKDPVMDEIVEDLIKAKSREDLVAYTHALDRVLQWNFYLIPHWHIDHWRLVWWNKLEKPAKLSDLTPGITDTWWAKIK
ncbi:MAG: ABC transporter substrate-binding protein [Micavibrio sp.]|nr:ABC transporter substrate-binding protein [Micavibrio sp.]MBK9561668.1 ABC transporter substrate-binding protein [Micavibrio sp.]